MGENGRAQAMNVSVIVCTWNNARRLAVTLDAMRRCTIPGGVSWELVLVANNCTDDTPGVARSFAGLLPLRYVEERRQGLSHARNTGLASAAGPFVVFADDDVTPSPRWLAEYWAAYRAHPRAYFGGPLTCEYESAPPEPGIARLAGMPVVGLDWGPHARELQPYERFLGANWACPAEALRAAGGFDPRLGLDASLGRRRVGEEWDLMERLRRHGFRPWYLPDAAVVHFVPSHKCRLPYTAQNWEASGFYAASRSTTCTPFFHARPHLRRYCEGRGFARVPWAAYAGATRFAAAWVLARLRGRAGYEEYASWRFCLGVIKGAREAAGPA